MNLNLNEMVPILKQSTKRSMLLDSFMEVARENNFIQQFWNFIATPQLDF